ncbi:uncharacterized protein LOC108676193 isoform X2 [Hyalella azteca]|nr:uncharacterized protein LOC108676193 isoform X2 [Hyalella azteca]
MQSSGTSVRRKLSPTIIGHYSMTGEDQAFDGRNCAKIDMSWVKASGKKYLKTRMDLNEVQLEDMKDDNNDSLKNLQQWILENPECMSPKPHFVTTRRVMRYLLTSIYPQMDELLVIHATKIGETIYMYHVASEKEEQKDKSVSGKKRKNSERTEEDKRKDSSYGFKFERCMEHGSKASTGNNGNKSYYVVVQAKLELERSSKPDHYTLLYKAEVDGMNKDFYTDDIKQHPNVAALIELKTCQLKIDAGARDKKKKQTGKLNVDAKDKKKTGMPKFDAEKQYLKPYTMRNAWAQCWSVGIPSVVCGFRDKSGVVWCLRSFRVDDLPDLQKRNFNKIDFSPDEMENGLIKFLQWAKTEVKDDEVVYELTVTQPRLLDNFSVKQPPPDKDRFRSSRLSPASQFLLLDFVQEMRSN